jgi:hypothetical protein
LKRQVEQLNIRINEIKRQEQVAEVVETDFFRDLQAKANMLRSQHQRKADKAIDQDNPTKNE